MVIFLQECQLFSTIHSLLKLQNLFDYTRQLRFYFIFISIKKFKISNFSFNFFRFYFILMTIKRVHLNLLYLLVQFLCLNHQVSLNFVARCVKNKPLIYYQKTSKRFQNYYFSVWNSETDSEFSHEKGCSFLFYPAFCNT